MKIPILPPFPPMEATTVEEIPTSDSLQYEPKWDGFRCITFRDGAEIYLQSKAGQPLARYFPEVVESLLKISAKKFVLDGELVIPEGKSLSFDSLLLRLHPAESRVRKLAADTPAVYIVFDLLVDERGRNVTGEPLAARREKLDAFAARFAVTPNAVRLSPATTSLTIARKWLNSAGTSLDGIMAKDLEMPYASGERTAMVKVKPLKTADCVVGGFRYASKGKLVGSLLLGLYDKDGLLHHVGFCSGIKTVDKPDLTQRLEALIKEPGFTGAAPGGPSRWATERSADWKRLDPKLVVEVGYDHFTGGRFRHGTRFLRWRPDKAPRQCTYDQIKIGSLGALKLLKLAA